MVVRLLRLARDQALEQGRGGPGLASLQRQPRQAGGPGHVFGVEPAGAAEVLAGPFEVTGFEPPETAAPGDRGVGRVEAARLTQGFDGGGQRPGPGARQALAVPGFRILRPDPRRHLEGSRRLLRQLVRREGHAEAHPGCGVPAVGDDFGACPFDRGGDLGVEREIRDRRRTGQRAASLAGGEPGDQDGSGCRPERPPAPGLPTLPVTRWGHPVSYDGEGGAPLRDAVQTRPNR